MLDLKFREIKKKDIPAVWKLLEQLKPLSEIKSEDFTPDIDDAWTEFNSIGIVGLDGDKVIAYGSLVVEHKIRGYQSCQIEDVVVDDDYRGKGVGEKLIEEMSKKAEKNGCYRVTLFCREELIPFYEKNNYKVNNVVMKRWF